MFAALRSKSKEGAALGEKSEDGGMIRRASSKRRGSKGHSHTIEQLQRKIAGAEDEIKHHLKHRCKHSAVHAIKKKQAYEKELAELMKEQGITQLKSEDSRKAVGRESEDIQIEHSLEPDSSNSAGVAASSGTQVVS
mmetsp:Transcript_58600/g.136879  ORF Transcript_58600/g.136879 Transcript_58600/m.136879 type:complete len:137 (-) Transcript_58600:76-486(-)